VGEDPASCQPCGDPEFDPLARDHGGESAMSHPPGTIPLMLTPSLRDSIVAHLRPAYAGRTVEEASYAAVNELGLMGLREHTHVDRGAPSEQYQEVRVLARIGLERLPMFSFGGATGCAQ
jgi:hypothetical protein